MTKNTWCVRILFFPDDNDYTTRDEGTTQTHHPSSDRLHSLSDIRSGHLTDVQELVRTGETKGPPSLISTPPLSSRIYKLDLSPYSNLLRILRKVVSVNYVKKDI